MSKITKRQAEATLAAVRKQFGAWLQDEAEHPEYAPKLIEDWNGPGWVISWESGAPFEWAHYAGGGDYIDEEFGFRVKCPPYPKGVFVEAYDHITLALYPA